MRAAPGRTSPARVPCPRAPSRRRRGSGAWARAARSASSIASRMTAAIEIPRSAAIRRSRVAGVAVEADGGAIHAIMLSLVISIRRRLTSGVPSTQIVSACAGCEMTGEQSNRFNVLLDDEHAARLHRLAARTYLNPGTLARSLLSTALDQADRIRHDHVAAGLDPWSHRSSAGGTRGHRLGTRHPARRAVGDGARRRHGVGSWRPSRDDPTHSLPASTRSRPGVPHATRSLPAARARAGRPVGGVPLRPRAVAVDAARLRLGRGRRRGRGRHHSGRPLGERRDERAVGPRSAPDRPTEGDGLAAGRDEPEMRATAAGRRESVALSVRATQIGDRDPFGRMAAVRHLPASHQRPLPCVRAGQRLVFLLVAGGADLWIRSPGRSLSPASRGAADVNEIARQSDRAVRNGEDSPDMSSPETGGALATSGIAASGS